MKMARGDQVEGLEDPGWSADKYGKNLNLGDYRRYSKNLIFMIQFCHTTGK